MSDDWTSIGLLSIKLPSGITDGYDLLSYPWGPHKPLCGGGVMASTSGTDACLYSFGGEIDAQAYHC